MGVAKGAVVGLLAGLLLAGAVVALASFAYAGRAGSYEVGMFGGVVASHPGLDRNETYALEVDWHDGATYRPMGAIDGLQPRKGTISAGPSALGKGGIELTSDQEYRLRLFSAGGALLGEGEAGQGTTVRTGLVVWGSTGVWGIALPLVGLVLGGALGAAFGGRPRRTKPSQTANPHLFGAAERPAPPEGGWDLPTQRALVKPADPVAAFQPRSASSPRFDDLFQQPLPRPAPSLVRYELRVVDAETGLPVQAAAENLDGAKPFGNMAHGNDGLLVLDGPPASQARVSAPGYDETVVDLRGNAPTEILLRRRRAYVEARVVGERTGQQLQGINVLLIKGTTPIGQAKTDLSGKVRFETTTSLEDCYVQTAVERDGFQDDAVRIPEEGGVLQLKVAYRFQPPGPDKDAEAGLRQDSERLVRQAMGLDPQVAAWMSQALTPFQEGMASLAEWGGLLLASPHSPTAIHRALAREGHNLLARYQTILSDKAVVNLLSSNRKALSQPNRLALQPDLLQQLVRSPAKIAEELAKAGRALTKMDGDINKLAAGADVLFVSLLWQAADKASKDVPAEGEERVAACLALAVQCALLDQVLKDASSRPSRR